MAHAVFVYGTLMHGEKEHELLEASVRTAEQSWLEGTLWNTGKGYPMLSVAGTESEGTELEGTKAVGATGTGLCREETGFCVSEEAKTTGSRVYGELYVVNDELLAKLTDLAEARGLQQQAVQVTTDQETVQALAFVTQPEADTDVFEKIGLGDWKCHQRIGTLPMLYFAYASCLDTERFQLAGVDGEFQDVAGLGVLDGYTLRFTYLAGDGAGRADVVEEGGAVEGKVYRIGREALDYLWGREGVETEEYRPAFITVEMNGEQHEALTFLVVYKSPADIPPPAHYVKEILRGAEGFVSPEYYEFLQKVTGQPDKL